jgi:hypothetical protein
LEGKRVTDVESEASLTQHRPLNLPGFSAVYFNIKYGKSGGGKRTQKQRKETVTKFLKL